MNLHQILARNYLIFSDEETDMLIAWDGGHAFGVFFGNSMGTTITWMIFTGK